MISTVRQSSIAVSVGALLATPTFAILVADGSGQLPTLGWNSWNAYHCDVDADKVILAANAMKFSGLQAAGYEYVNIDDCWSVKSGRNAFGYIMEDPVKFPNGMKALVDQLHGDGFKAGIYSSAGTTTCAGYPASLGIEDNDAAEFATWGIDYLKYDNCGAPSDWQDEWSYCNPDFNANINGTCTGDFNPPLAPPGYDWATSKSANRFARMRDALAKQSRTIVLAVCAIGNYDVFWWGPNTGINWRMSNDIQPTWGDVTRIINHNSFHLDTVNFFGRNDMDMLEVGNGLSPAEERSHFAIWAAMKSPLLIGTDITKLNTDQYNLLKNKYLLAFNQDNKYGGPATPYKWGTNPNWTWDSDHPAEYYSGQSQAGVLVLMLNTQGGSQSKTATFAEIPHLGGSGNYRVIDVWTGNDLGCRKSYTVNVASHDTAVILVTGSC